MVEVIRVAVHDSTRGNNSCIYNVLFGNQPDLQRLEIKELENRTIPLTDVTGYLAFLQMSSLKILDIGSTLVIAQFYYIRICVSRSKLPLES